ncbi:MAG: metallophosphoesterase family protein [Phycisphaeraceae bacterium]|nr:metallophosphoesterase family protein [Phycisphaeraceae bacterium]MCW5755026.1 metallophosphoesterase family protein [Phycisphaeraceae bacterium]
MKQKATRKEASRESDHGWGALDTPQSRRRGGLVEHYDLPHPAVPPGLEGFSILHLTDFHTTRRRRPVVLGQLLDEIGRIEVDLVALTGDYMDHPGDEGAALEVLAEVLGRVRSRQGAVGIFGNHDTAAFRREARGVGAVRWLEHEGVHLEGVGLTVAGASFPEDVLRTALETGSSGFVLGLVHYPSEMYPASEVGWPVVLAGHTHGGQVRLGATRTPHTSCDLPSGAASGVICRGETVCAISRGLGETVARVRFRCPAQAPVYRLVRGPIGEVEAWKGDVGRLRAW